MSVRQRQERFRSEDARLARRRRSLNLIAQVDYSDTWSANSPTRAGSYLLLTTPESLRVEHCHGNPPRSWVFSALSAMTTWPYDNSPVHWPGFQVQGAQIGFHGNRHGRHVLFRLRVRTARRLRRAVRRRAKQDRINITIGDKPATIDGERSLSVFFRAAGARVSGDWRLYAVEGRGQRGDSLRHSGTPSSGTTTPCGSICREKRLTVWVDGKRRGTIDLANITQGMAAAAGSGPSLPWTAQVRDRGRYSTDNSERPRVDRQLPRRIAEGADAAEPSEAKKNTAEGESVRSDGRESHDASHDPKPPPKPERRVYARRALGRDHDHRDPDRAVASGGASCPRSGETDAMLQQPEAVGLGDGELRERQRLLSPMASSTGRPAPAASSRTASAATAPSFARPSSSPSGRIWKAATFTTSYDFTYTFYSLQNRTVVNTPMPIYYCPSDRPGGVWNGDQYTRLRGNYVTNWGYCDFTQTVAKPDGVNPLKHRPVARGTRIGTLWAGIGRRRHIGRPFQHHVHGRSDPGAQRTDFDFRGDILNDD